MTFTQEKWILCISCDFFLEFTTGSHLIRAYKTTKRNKMGIKFGANVREVKHVTSP